MYCDIDAKIHRQKFKQELLEHPVNGVITGEWHGTANWDLVQSLHFDLNLKGDLHYRIKWEDQEIAHRLEWQYSLNPEVI